MYNQEREPDLPETSFVHVSYQSRPYSFPHPHTFADHEDHMHAHDPLPADTHNYPESDVTDPIIDYAAVADASSISLRSSGLAHP